MAIDRVPSLFWHSLRRVWNTTRRWPGHGPWSNSESPITRRSHGAHNDPLLIIIFVTFFTLTKWGQKVKGYKGTISYYISCTVPLARVFTILLYRVFPVFTAFLVWKYGTAPLVCEEGTNFFLENCQFEVVKVPVYFTSQILKTRADGTAGVFTLYVEQGENTQKKMNVELRTFQATQPMLV